MDRNTSIIFILILFLGVTWRIFALPQELSYQESRARMLFLKGIEHYNEGRYYSALDAFRRLKSYPPGENPHLTASYLMEMKSYFHIGKYEEAKKTGRSFLRKFPQSRYKAYVIENFGDIFVQEGRYRLAIENYLNVRKRADSDSQISIIDNKILRLIKGFLNSEDVKDLLETEVDSINRSILTLISTNDLLYRGEVDNAALTLFRLDTKSLPQVYYDAYNQARKETYRESQRSAVIGVVLPLSGIDENIGHSFLRGLKNAINRTKNQSGLNIILEVMDNGGENLRTVKCIETLLGNSNISVILGPFSSINAATAGATIRGKEIPLLLPFTTQVGLSDLGENIFQLKTDLNKQGRYAAEYAIISLHLDTLAIVAPADRIGRELTDGFVQRADELGAHIVAIEWYSGVPYDLSEQFIRIRKIGFDLMAEENEEEIIHLDIDEFDSTFFISVADFFPEEIESYKEEEAVDSSRIEISVIQGIYLPIHSGDINYIGSQFSSYHFKTQIIGNEGWYNLDELDQEMIGPHFNGMIILSDYLEPGDQEIRSSDNLSIEQEVITEKNKIMSLGEDIMDYIIHQIGENRNKIEIVNNLKKGIPYRGRGKIFSFSDVTPRVNSSIFVLQYKNHHFHKIDEFISDTMAVSTSPSP